MSRFKPSQRLSITQRIPSCHSVPVRCPTRAYAELGRPPGLAGLPQRRPPYLEVLATALAFAFLVYRILGGA